MAIENLSLTKYYSPIWIVYKAVQISIGDDTETQTAFNCLSVANI